MLAAAPVTAAPQEDGRETPTRYVNPLAVEGAGSLADPTVIRVGERYYLYATGGLGPDTSIWSSDNLVDWEHHVAQFEGHGTSDAPAAFLYRDHVYVAGNGTGLFRSADPLGPFEYLGDFSDHEGRRPDWGMCPGCEDGGFFDPTFFVDDDDRLYVYYAGPGPEGIYGAELDPDNPTHLLGPVQLFFAFEPDHIWERYGNRNEYATQSWVEGPWMTKHDGTYYLQYSAPGTDWITYAVGVYTGSNPLGPFTYYEGNPVLLHRRGMLNGVGHNSVVEGPDGTLWTFYNILYRNWNRELDRRIGMDPVGFDAAGNMVIEGPSETPQWAPGTRPDPWKGNATNSIPLSEDKNYRVSSEQPGREAPFAFDNNARTEWTPAADDVEPWLELDLGAEAPDQQFMVDSARILFSLPEGVAVGSAAPRARRYRLEVSSDGETYTTVVDKTANTFDNAVEFDDIEPVQCRYVRFTITGWPPELPRGLVELTIFGR